MLHTSALKLAQLQKLLTEKRQYRYAAIGFVVVLVLLTGLVVWQKLNHGPSNTPVAPAVVKKPEPPKFASPLTGELLLDEALTKRPVTAVMIENSPDARPQSGLRDAGVVYEAIAEGGITRFLALYQEGRPGLIGPVRSVRPYFVEWGGAYDAAVAHIGGSSRALQMIRSGSYGLDIDQFFNAGYYWRANDRAAPHNVYTDTSKLDALIAAKGKSASSFTPIERKDKAKSSAPNATHINLPISSARYSVDYDFDAASNSYLRSIGGEPHLDREAGRITADTVVAIQVNMTKQMEDGFREQITTTGSGTAYVFQDGIVTQAVWQRPDVKDQITFVDTSGKPLVLNRGKTWITAMPAGRNPVWQ